MNFSRSNLVDMNVDKAFLGISINVLYYELETLPFKYFGLPVGSILLYSLLGSL